MSAIDALLQLLSSKMNEVVFNDTCTIQKLLLKVIFTQQNATSHSLQPILSLLSCLSQTSRDIRKYCKSVSTVINGYAT